VVKVGFIVEGACERIILESPGFRRYLENIGLDFIPEVIDIEGGGNLLPEHREESVNFLIDKGATHILILGDQEDATCITSVKQHINPGINQTVAISVKALEAWFLADTNALHNYLSNNYMCVEPETYLPPLDELKRLRMLYKNRGINDKKILANQMVFIHGFKIENAAQHPKCSSAKYFLRKIQEIAAEK
jgi:hypothetical protein